MRLIKILLFSTLIFPVLVLTSIFVSKTFAQSDNGIPKPPIIEFTSIPAFGSFDNLVGRVRNISPTNFSQFQVAVYIRVAHRWWTKPYAAQPLTIISPFGTWSCDITTGGIDQEATEIAAFLITQSNGITFQPPVLLGAPELPASLYQYSVANAHTVRLPGSTKIRFSGYEWLVKKSSVPVGPGPNYFSDSSEAASVDATGNLHLKIKNIAGVWYSSEVILPQTLGFGKYIFTLTSRADLINENAVLGLFTWNDDPAYAHREIDIEFSRWSNPANPDNAQYVVQPWDLPGHLNRFNIQLDGDSVHQFEWKNGVVSFESKKSTGEILKSWVYSGSDVPIPGGENPRINLWMNESRPPSDGQEVEVIIKKFEFVPVLINRLGPLQKIKKP